MKTLKAGDRLRVTGTRWGNQSVHTMKESIAKYGPHPHDFGDYAWLSANAVVLDGRVPAPRIEVAIGEVVLIEGYGTYEIARPNSSSGDSCMLKPVKLEPGIVTQEAAGKLRIEKIGYPRYDNS